MTGQKGRGANQREDRGRGKWQSTELGKAVGQKLLLGSHGDLEGSKRETGLSFSLALAKEFLKEGILESECFGKLLYAS